MAHRLTRSAVPEGAEDADVHRTALILRLLAGLSGLFAGVELAGYLIWANPLLLPLSVSTALAAGGFLWALRLLGQRREASAMSVAVYAFLLPVAPCVLLLPMLYPFWVLLYLLAAWFVIQHREGAALRRDLFACACLMVATVGIGIWRGNEVVFSGHEGDAMLAAGCAAVIVVLLISFYQFKQRLQANLERLEDAARLAQEQALRVRESEQRFTDAAQHAPLKLWITAPDGLCTFINRSWCDYVGHPMATQLGLGWLDALHADEVAAVSAVFMTANAARAPYSAEYRLRRYDGVYRWHTAAAQPRINEQGEFLGFIGSVVDIHDQKRTQEELTRQVEERTATLNAILDAMPNAVVVTDLAGRLLINNRAAQELSGFPTEDIPADRNLWPALYGIRDRNGRVLDVTEVPLLRALEGETVPTSELLLQNERRPQGVMVEATARPLLDARGKRFAALTVFTDVSHRLAAERALRESEARFRLISDITPQILWTASARGEIDFVNQAGLVYHGGTLEQVLGSSWLDAVHPEDRAATEQSWRHSLQTGQAFEAQYRLRRQDGVYRWHIARGVPQMDAEQRPLRWYGLTADVEELKRAQQAAEEAVRMKSAFLSSMSHEIRTPMNAVIGMTSILLDSPLSPQQRDSAEVIRSSGEHLLTVINDILDYSKIEAGGMRLEREVFSLRDCVESALDLVAANATTRQVEIGYFTEAGMPDAVLGDAGRLRQVLVNLLSNAVKFTPPRGQVAVELRTRARTGAELEVEFEVRDTGIGMSVEVLSRLFQSFMQGDASTTRLYGGTGLGLSISKRLVELMGGDIRVSSEPGKGSVFTFTICTSAAAVNQRVQALVQPELKGKRVLIVDDIEINRRILLHYCTLWGMQAFATESPRAAQEWITHGDPFDVALLDYHMPDIDGLTLARTLRAARSEQELPIVILSSAVADACQPGVVTAAIRKPIKPSRLLDELHTLFATRTTAGPGPTQPVLPRDLGSQHPLRILVAEDNSVNQKVARLLLERLGYQPDFAGDGREALEAIGRQTYDVVFMDVQMPVMDGLEATREIQRRWLPGARPRIVAMTANATVEDREACERAGMEDYVAKPVVAERLIQALRDCPRREDGAASQRITLDFSADGLLSLRQSLGEEGAVEVVAALLAELPKNRQQMLDRGPDTDIKTPIRAAHTLKSNCRMIGAEDLGACYAELEQSMAKEGLTDAAIQQLVTLLQRYEALLMQAREALPP